MTGVPIVRLETHQEGDDRQEEARDPIKLKLLNTHSIKSVQNEGQAHAHMQLTAGEVNSQVCT